MFLFQQNYVRVYPLTSDPSNTITHFLGVLQNIDDPDVAVAAPLTNMTNMANIANMVPADSNADSGDSTDGILWMDKQDLTFEVPW